MLMMRKCSKTRVLKIFAFCCICILLYVLTCWYNIRCDQIQSAFRSQDPTSRAALVNWLVANHTSTTLPSTSAPEVLHGESSLVEHYCNTPFKTTTGDEGKPQDGFKLEQVHIFTRHGDRTPMRTIPGYEFEGVNCNFDTWYTGSNSKIQNFTTEMKTYFVQQFTSNRLQKWAAYPNKDRCTEQHLTSQGALQHINLGLHFQNSYIVNSDLFDSRIPIQSQMYICSTDYPRTYQSALALLYGFLPTFNLTHVNMTTSLNLHFCSKMYTGQNTCYCPHSKILLSKAEAYASKMNAKSEAFSRVKIAISKIVPSSVLSSVADSLMPRFCHGLSYPCLSNTSFTCANISLLEDIWKEITASDKRKFNDPDQNYVKLSSIIMYPVLAEIIRRMKDITLGRHAYKFVLYSGHDVTLSPLLVILGLHDGRWPPYASHIVIELHFCKKCENGRNYYVRFLHNGIDKTKEVYFCKRQIYENMCDVKSFVHFVLKKLIQRYGFESFSKACTV